MHKEDRVFHLVNNACSDNFDVIHWPVLSAGLHHPYSLQNGDSLRYSSKNTVLSIQPLSGCKRKKELASVCVWSSVGHRQNTSTWQTYKWGDFQYMVCLDCSIMLDINAIALKADEI